MGRKGARRKKADLPELGPSIAAWLDSDNGPGRGGRAALAKELGVSPQYFGKWLMKSCFPRTKLPALLAGLVGRGMQLPSQHTEGVRLRYSFTTSDDSNTQRSENFASFWRDFARSDRRIKLDTVLACRLLDCLAGNSFMLLFTTSVFPIIYREHKSFEPIYDALAGALGRGATVVVFAPSHELVSWYKKQVGEKGLYESAEFEQWARNVKNNIKNRLIRRMSADKDHHAKMVRAEKVVHEQLLQVYCDRIACCCPGRVTILFGEAELGSLMTWGAERFADDTFVPYTDDVKYATIWKDRVLSEALCHFGGLLDDTNAKALLAERTKPVPEKQRRSYDHYRECVMTHGLEGVTRLRGLLRTDEEMMLDR